MFGNVNGECLSIFFGFLCLRSGCLLGFFDEVSRLIALNRRGLCRLIGLLITLRLLLLDWRFLAVHILCRRLILVRGLYLIGSRIILASLRPVLGIVCVPGCLIVCVEFCSASLAEAVARHVFQTAVPTV